MTRPAKVDASGDDGDIRHLIETQFASLAWSQGGEADWAAFADGFVPGAPLFPAARPVRAITGAAFQSRMCDLATQGVLASFAERPMAIRVMRFGAVAVALAGCEITENGSTVTRDVSAFLLVRSDGRWRVAAQGWDAETETNPIPPNLLDAGTAGAV